MKHRAIDIVLGLTFAGCAVAMVWAFAVAIRDSRSCEDDGLRSVLFYFQPIVVNNNTILVPVYRCER